MSASGAAPLRILIVHGALLHRIFEASEVWQTVAALLNARRRDEASVSVSNCRKVWEVALVDGRPELGAARSLVAAWRDGFDVVHVHLAIPLRHLLWAVLFRVRGAPVVFSPMALLGSDFAQASWFRTRHPMFQRVKPLLVSLLAGLWRAVSTWVMCLSEAERRQTRIPADKTLLSPWPLPDTPLAEAILSDCGWPRDRRNDPTGPLAFVARLDPWRKGIDRLCRWTAAYASSLRRPAVLLLAPAADDAPPDLEAAVAQGVIEWDPQSHGADLLPRLRTCRGAVLLSRWEAQPRALREAVLAGLPTISTPSTHFQEIVEVLGCGVIVDGDDPHAVQSAFDAVADQAPTPGATEALFGMKHQGRWLLDVYGAVAQGRAPDERDYYRVAQRLAPTLEDH